MANRSRLLTWGARLFGKRRSPEPKQDAGDSRALLFHLNWLGACNRQPLSVCFVDAGDAVATSAAIGTARTAATASRGRVLLMDANAQSAKVTAQLQLDGKRGLADVLASSNGIAEAIFETSLDQLFVMPVGDSTALQGVEDSSGAFAGLLKHLLSDFDLVVIDASGSDVAADEVARLRHVDKLLLALKPNSNMQTARRTKQQMQRLGANIAGVVLGG